jgi:predicted TIM-barrel fold metal-dependent hydrolase
MRLDRLMFGTDFPNIPYAWDRELRRLTTLKLDEKSLRQVLSENAAALYQIDLDETIP